MTTRSNNRGNALRRLMTEYKQLTAGGSYSDISQIIMFWRRLWPRRFTRWNVHCWSASTALFPLLKPLKPLSLSRSHLRVWLLHLGGVNLRSERYTLCKYWNKLACHLISLHFCKPNIFKKSGRWRVRSQADICMISPHTWCWYLTQTNHLLHSCPSLQAKWLSTVTFRNEIWPPTISSK